MSTFYKGETQILYIVEDSVDYPIACLTENSLSEDLETMETTTIDNGGWRTYQPLNQGYTLNFSGIQIWSNVDDTDKYSYDILMLRKRARTKITWKIRTNNGEIQQQGEGYITELSESSPVGDLVSFSGTILGTGSIETTFDYTFESGEGYLFEDQDGFIFN